MNLQKLYWLSQDVPGNPAMQLVSDNPNLSRVLLIGDSISIGHTTPVRGQLQGVANVHRIPENEASTTFGLEKIAIWLGTEHWDVIHYNWGLHDLKLQIDRNHMVPVGEHERDLRILVTRLK